MALQFGDSFESYDRGVVVPTVIADPSDHAFWHAGYDNAVMTGNPCGSAIT